MFELLPGIGILLPAGAGTLRFGMDGVTAQETLARLGPVHHEQVPDAAWTHTVRWGDVELAAGAVEVGPSGSRAADPALTRVVLRQVRPTGSATRRLAAGGDALPPVWQPAAVPVVLGGIDLFGYPAAEVREALEPDLGAGRLPGLRLRPVVPGGYLPAVSLRAVGRPGAADEPSLASYEEMWTTGRDHWQLERTGSGGHLIVTKGDDPMYLLVCHDRLADEIIARMLAAGVEVVDG